MVMHTICPRHCFRWGEVFPGGAEALPLVTGLVTRCLGMQKSYCRLDWYMGVCSERLLVRFLLDILKSTLVDLDNSAWEWIDDGKVY